MADRCTIMNAVRLRRSRLLAAVPFLVLAAGLAVVRLHHPDPERMLRPVPRLAPRGLALDGMVPEPLRPAVGQADRALHALRVAWENDPEPTEVRERREALTRYELVVFFSLGLLLAILRFNPWPQRSPGRIDGDEAGLRFRGRPLVARDRLSQGLLRPGRAGRVVARLERKGVLPIAHDIELADAAEGRELLRALGLDASQRAATFYVGSLAKTTLLFKYGLLVLRVVVLLAAGFLAMAFTHYGMRRERALAGLLLVGFFVALWVLRRFPVQVRVGTDGVLQRWLFVRRYTPFGSVRAVEPFDWGVRLHLTEGSSAEVTVFRPSVLVPRALVQRLGRLALWLGVQRDLLAQRIEEARLSRTGRPSLVDLAERSGNTEVLEDCWEDPQRRAVAAVALAREIRDGRYFRGLAEATAHPDLRDVLLALAEDDDGRLLRSMNRLSRAEVH